MDKRKLVMGIAAGICLLVAVVAVVLQISGIGEPKDKPPETIVEAAKGDQKVIDAINRDIQLREQGPPPGKIEAGS